MNHLTRLLTFSLLCGLLLAACAPQAPAATITPLPPTDTPIPAPTETSESPTVTPTLNAFQSRLATLTAQPFRTPTVTPIVEGKVDVGGYGLYIYCTGSGYPTVILENGYVITSERWDSVVREVKQFAQVCVYDRAGLGRSDPAPAPRTAKDMAEDLHTLLTNAKVEGLYVLVGWSLGGFIIRLYADQFPQDVTGMVLVDSSHPDQDARNCEVLPPPSENENQDLKDFRASCQVAPDPSTMPEGLDWLASCTQVRSTSSLGDIPLVVITAGLSDYPPGFSEELVSQLNMIRTELQNELAALSTNSSQVTAKLSHHCVMCREPEVIVEAIQEVVDEVRNK